MKTLTFAFDVQLNENEDWIPGGTKVTVLEVKEQIEGSTPVIITEAFTYDGTKIEIEPTVEWFMNSSFEELR